MGTFLFSVMSFSLYIYNSWSVDTDVRYMGPTITISTTTTTSMRELIHDASIRAKQSGALSTRVISAPTIVQASGINYAISYADLKPKEDKVNINEGSKADPFDREHRDDDLFVARLSTTLSEITQAVTAISVSTSKSASVDVSDSKLPSISQSSSEEPHPHALHSSKTKHFFLQLNKFNTMADHTLIVTDDYEEQTSPLDAADLAAWYYTILSTNSVGFFNSDFIAGASQRHKHMQIIPQDSFWSVRPPDALFALPIDHAILSRIVSRKWRPGNCGALKITKYPTTSLQGRGAGWGFVHSVAVLQSIEDGDPQERAEEHECQYSRLHHAYCAVLRDIGASAPACGAGTPLDRTPDASIKPRSYNLILTRHWIMAVARSSRDALGGTVGVNAFAFVGLLLARSQEALDQVVEVGPLDILKGVTVPR